MHYYNLLQSKIQSYTEFQKCECKFHILVMIWYYTHKKECITLQAIDTYKHTIKIIKAV